MRQTRLVLLTLLLLVAPAGQSAINKPLPYEGTSTFTDDFGSLPALVSGALDYRADAIQNTSLLLETTGFTVEDMDRVCWEQGGTGQCITGSALSIDVDAGSSVAVQSPRAYDVRLIAEHALAFFADAAGLFGEDRPEDLHFGPSIVAFPTEGSIRIRDVEPNPVTVKSNYRSFDEAARDMAVLIGINDAAEFTVRNDGSKVVTIDGDSSWVGFQGNSTFDSTDANVAAIAMPEGASGFFAPAAEKAARDGLASGGIGDALGSIEESEGADDASDLEGVSDVSDALADILNGAIVGFDSGDVGGSQSTVQLLESITLIRFKDMTIERVDDGVVLDGHAQLQIEDGEVHGAKKLVGFIPLLSIILWGVALLFWFIRVGVKADKHHRFWDKVHWIGWLLGVGATAALFWLWDREVAELWGTSIMQSDSSGGTLAVIATLQIIPLLLAMLFFGAPAHSLMKTLVRLIGQGRMMNIAGIVAPFVAFVLGAPLMLSLLDALLQLTNRLN